MSLLLPKQLSSVTAPLIDLRYLSIVLRLLVFGILFVLMDTLPGHGQMNSALVIDLMFFNSILIWKT